MILKTSELMADLWAQLGSVEIKAKDERLFAPSKQWLMRKFSPAWKAYAAVNLRWEDQSNDCDDITMECICALTRSLRKNKKLVGKCSHSIGYCELQIFPGHSLNNIRDGGHATCLAYLSDKNWYFYEPQNTTITLAKPWIDSGAGRLLWVRI